MLGVMALPRSTVALAFAAGCLAVGLAAQAEPAASEDADPAEPAEEFELPIHEGVPWPIVRSPIDSPRPHAPAPSDPAPPPATRAGEKVMAIVDNIRATLVESSYQHSTKVRADDGVYHWDCSGMTAWILRRSAPRALRAINSKRPVARDFVKVINKAPTDRARSGWQRIDRIADVRPGDVFAWKRPRGLPSKNTGHVGIVVDQPVELPGAPGAWVVRIADSTSGGHQDDTRVDDEDGGFGIGTIVILADDAGRGTHYGWSGTFTDWFVTTPIVFGRVSS
jgi:hypothetical protein